MPIKNGYWIPEMSARQEEVFFCHKRAILVSGPRETGKTISCLHKIIKHLWETPGARFGVFGKTIKNVKEAGIVKDITEFIMPLWLSARVTSPQGHTMEYTSEDNDGNSGPKVDGATKTWYFKIRNYWGGESELLLFSLEHDHEVEDKLKNTRFSGLYFPELDRWKDKRVFSVSYHQLRMLHLKDEDHLWIADTNPAEEGPDHFAYKLWYEQLIEEEEDREFYKDFAVFEMYFEDNPWLTPKRIAYIKSLYRSDADLWNRYVLGKWLKLSTDGLFSSVFSRGAHVLGNSSSPTTGDWEILVPAQGSKVIATGWDLGDLHHAIVFAAKRETETENGDQRVDYDFIDEIVFIREKVSIRDITELALERIEYWESKLKEMYGKNAFVFWRHWSDQSAMFYKSAIDGAEELVVRAVSNGKINLRAPGAQAPKSLNKRVKMLRRIIFEDRFRMSAQLKHLQDCLMNLRSERGKVDTPNRSDPLKHVFDATTYLIVGEEPESLDFQLKPAVSSAGARRSSILTVSAR